MNEFEAAVAEHNGRVSSKKSSDKLRRDELERLHARALKVLHGTIEPELQRCEDEIRSTGKLICALWSSTEPDKYGTGLTLQLFNLHNNEEPDTLRFMLQAGEIAVEKSVHYAKSNRNLDIETISAAVVRTEVLIFFKEVLRRLES
jgi:hypothetical protein